MKKGIGILLGMVILIGIPVAVKASEASIVADGTINSYGSIFYEDANGSVRIYAEDIVLLQEKLATIPEDIFDPVLYSHTHLWEYVDITEQEHTKHCNICGSKYDVVNQHTVAKSNACTISFGGQDYPGYEEICECGYKWEEEIYHNVIFMQKDETCHTLSCVLNSTPYCIGMEVIDVPHGLTLSPTDESHHQNVCTDCGYQEGDIEACVFDIEEDNVEDGEPAPDVVGKVIKYCECGNFITESQIDTIDTGVTEPEMPDTEKIEPSEISISGNDIESVTADQTTEKTKEIIEEKGENKL